MHVPELRREAYVRPPLVPREAPSPRLVLWRFRLIAGLLLLVLLLVVLQTFLHFAAPEDPGLGIGLGAPTLTASAAP